MHFPHPALTRNPVLASLICFCVTGRACSHGRRENGGTAVPHGHELQAQVSHSWDIHQPRHRTRLAAGSPLTCVGDSRGLPPVPRVWVTLATSHLHVLKEQIALEQSEMRGEHHGAEPSAAPLPHPGGLQPVGRAGGIPSWLWHGGMCTASTKSRQHQQSTASALCISNKTRDRAGAAAQEPWGLSRAGNESCTEGDSSRSASAGPSGEENGAPPGKTHHSLTLSRWSVPPTRDPRRAAAC